MKTERDRERGKGTMGERDREREAQRKGRKKEVVGEKNKVFVIQNCDNEFQTFSDKAFKCIVVYYRGYTYTQNIYYP